MPEQRHPSGIGWRIALGLAVSGALLTAACGGRPEARGARTQPAPAAGEPAEKGTAQTPGAQTVAYTQPELGTASAAVTIEEYADFQ